VRMKRRNFREAGEIGCLNVETTCWLPVSLMGRNAHLHGVPRESVLALEASRYPAVTTEYLYVISIDE
jgi:hypothetical protein